MKKHIAITLGLVIASGAAMASDGNVVTSSIYSGAANADSLATSGGIYEQTGDLNFEGQSRDLIGEANALSGSDSPDTGDLSTDSPSNGDGNGIEDGVTYGLTEGSEVTTNAAVESSKTTTDAIIDGQDVLFESLNRSSEGETMPIGELGDDVATELRNGQQDFATAVNDGQDEFAAGVEGGDTDMPEGEDTGGNDTGNTGTSQTNANVQASDGDENSNSTQASASEDEASAENEGLVDDSETVSFSDPSAGF